MRYLLHDVFTESVKNFPNNTAIQTEDKREYTYSEVNQMVNKYGNLLRQVKKDIRKNPYVGILSPVGPDSIAAVLGTLKIGGVYVPLDEYSPFERLKHIVKSTNLDIIVVDASLYSKHIKLLKMKEVKKVVITGDCDKSIITNEKITISSSLSSFSVKDIVDVNQVSDDLAYILHSSGSTGVPKGIMLTHRNARTFVDWMQKEFKLTERDIVMSRAPFKFDLSVFDIFNTFKAGAKLICFDWSKEREGDKKHSDYVKLMEEVGATILYTTPSTFISLLNRGNLAEAKLQLREIMYAGEPFPVPQLRRLQAVLPDTKIANIYGPTETNIITYYWVRDIPEDVSSIPLGDTVDDTEIIVVTEDKKRICDFDEIGELWCRGGTVTIGYLGMPEKTKEFLVQSPFHKYPVFYWRTGDYGFRDKQGCLHYRGRKDHMIKVKGFRIELGEVETAISTFKGIDEFAVVPLPDIKYGNRLYCYYSKLANFEFTSNDLIKHLKSRLPSYMIPFQFKELSVLPKTSSGKIDRIKLVEDTANII